MRLVDGVMGLGRGGTCPCQEMRHWVRFRGMKVIPVLFCMLMTWTAFGVTPDGRRKLVLIAGKPSHPSGMHEFRAGTMLLEKCLAGVQGLVVERHEMGWVKDEATLRMRMPW